METDSKINITPFLTLLTILFVILRLFGAIKWPWLWVFAPLWIPIVIIVAFIALGLVAILIDKITN